MAAATMSAPSSTRCGAPERSARSFWLAGSPSMAFTTSRGCLCPDARHLEFARRREPPTAASGQPRRRHRLDQSISPRPVGSARKGKGAVDGQVARDVGPARLVPGGQHP